MLHGTTGASDTFEPTDAPVSSMSQPRLVPASLPSTAETASTPRPAVDTEAASPTGGVTAATRCCSSAATWPPSLLLLAGATTGDTALAVGCALDAVATDAAVGVSVVGISSRSCAMMDPVSISGGATPGTGIATVTAAAAAATAARWADGGRADVGLSGVTAETGVTDRGVDALCGGGGVTGKGDVNVDGPAAVDDGSDGGVVDRTGGSCGMGVGCGSDVALRDMGGPAGRARSSTLSPALLE